MKDACAISAQLVDIRNVGTLKSVKLTLHVPEEQALRVTEMFGWPTGANPVPVGIARLLPESQREQGQAAETKPRPVQSPGSVGAERRRFDELAPSQQAGILCNEPAFAKFLDSHYGHIDNVDAAGAVRQLCNVTSRSEISPDNKIWRRIVSDYRAWQIEASVVPA